MDTPLSNKKIIKELGPPSEDVLLYRDLHKFDSIEELFLEDNLRIILIESKKKLWPLGKPDKKWRYLYLF